MTEIAIDALRDLLSAIPKTDRGILWKRRDWDGAEKLEVHCASATAFKYILDNTDDVIAALSALHAKAGVSALVTDAMKARAWKQLKKEYRGYVTKGMSDRILEAALSTKLQEPVAWRWRSVPDGRWVIVENDISSEQNTPNMEVQPLYAHQPVTAGLEKAIAALTDYQQQLDQDGIMVGVSREALEMVLAALKSEGHNAQPDILAGIDRLANGGLRK